MKARQGAGVNGRHALEHLDVGRLPRQRCGRTAAGGGCTAEVDVDDAPRDGWVGARVAQKGVRSQLERIRELAAKLEGLCVPRQKQSEKPPEAAGRAE